MRNFIQYCLYGFLLILLCVDIALGAAATMYTTVAGAGAKDGANWANAFGYAEWEVDLEGNAEDGDIYYVKEGTYTLTSTFQGATAGAATAIIQVIGVKSTTANEPPILSDYAYGTARPLIACGASYWAGSWDKDYWRWENIRLTGTGAFVFLLDTYSQGYNLKAENTSGTGGRDALVMYHSVIHYISCEAVSTNGEAIAGGTGKYGLVAGCYIHDSDVGLEAKAGSWGSINNIIDTCTTGILLTAAVNTRVVGNTIYDCTTGILGTSSFAGVYLNNIIDNCTTGASWTAAAPTNLWDYNIWSNNNTDTVNVTKGLNAITSNITLTDPGNGDFTLPDSSVAEDAGLQVDTNTGVTGDYNVNIGADQTDTQAGGGGGGVGGHISIY